jgi:hypothetical protein
MPESEGPASDPEGPAASIVAATAMKSRRPSARLVMRSLQAAGNLLPEPHAGNPAKPWRLRAQATRRG